MIISACSDDKEGKLNGLGQLTVTLDGTGQLLLPDGYPSGMEITREYDENLLTLSMSDLVGQYHHTWEHFSDFPQGDSYFVGEYKLTATYGDPSVEGFDCPAYTGITDVPIYPNQRTDAVVHLTAANAFFTLDLTECENAVSATFNTPGGEFIDYLPADEGILCMKPGPTDIYLNVSLPAGRSVRYLAATLPDTRAETIYQLKAVRTADELTLHTPQGDFKKALTEEFLAAQAPEVTYMPATEIILPEGDKPATGLYARVNAGARKLSRLLLTTRSASLQAKGMPAQIDLLNLTPGQAETIAALGFTYTNGAADFTSLLGNLVYLTERDAVSTFALTAIDTDGRTSEPAVLTVTTLPVEIQITDSSPVVMGIDKAAITVACSNPGFKEHVEVEVMKDNVWAKTPVSVSETSPGQYLMTFDMPEGNDDPQVRVLYCDEVRHTLSLKRTMPSFTLMVDAFAKSAVIKIESEDQSLLGIITSKVHIYVDGKPTPSYHRLPDHGIVTVLGLNPGSTYTFKATMMDDGEGIPFTPEVRATTEHASQLGNGDFEERSGGPSWDNMPSGGTYAQTSVDIFDRQHHTTITTEVPKGWATVNAKTFCGSSRNVNTWYMQPSAVATREDAFSGSYAVKLTSVAFDPNGAQIPPYAQTSTPFLDYSPIVPDISYRAAGRLFLGSYSFDAADMTEKYNEGTSWSTRPSSLNFYYKFFPGTMARDDRGMVRIELTGNDNAGNEVIVAESTAYLPLATSFTAFSVPLNYQTFGIKARRLKVMFTSSEYAGTIAGETSSIVTTPDPMTATSTGGTLWIDNITFAY